MQEGCWSRCGASRRGARWARWVRHRHTHLRASHSLERHTAVLLTSPTHKRRAPSFGSQSPSIRRPVSTQPRCGGPFLTRVPVCTLIHGPAWASSPSIWTSVHGQHHSSRGSKTFTYHVWGASCMLPHLPLKLLHFHPSHPTPPRTRIRRKRALPPSGAPLIIVTPSPGSRLTHKQKTYRKQGECHQYRATHLRSLKTLTLSDLLAWSQTWTRRKSNPRALMRTNEGEHCRLWALQQPWPRVPPASNPLARLREPPSLSPRR